MTFTLTLAPEVEDDARLAERWYEEGSPGLGDRYLDEFYDGLNGIRANPLLYEAFQDEIRRRLLRRFPYAIYFTVEAGQITVWALLHCARDPQRIAAELRDRGRN